MNRNSQRGVALVITLLMLAIITLITVVFLATAKRDSSATNQALALTDAEQSAEAALRRAIADMVSQVMARGDLTGYELTVSRNYDLDPVATNAGMRDVRVPVFVNTNRNGTTGPLEDRFYLDLNRNRRFDTNTLGSPGDPEFIGTPNKLGEAYSERNKFISRYAYIILPAGKALDVNQVHNDAASYRPQGFFRDQGYGPWEINLGGFFADLYPNVWNNSLSSPYRFGPIPAPVSSGFAFDDAFSLVNYRNPTASFRTLFGNAGAQAFESDNITGGARGPLFPGGDTDNANLPWAGAESARHYFTLSDFFNSNKTSVGFVNRLNDAVNQDGSVFYRMLAQLTTDSAPEPTGKINLNYDTTLGKTATDFVSWDAQAVVPAPPDAAAQGSVRFFTNVAAQLFALQSKDFPFASILEIPIAPTNYYSAAVHRILQQAANIYDATRNDRFPSVFRPLFTSNIVGSVTNVYVTGYTNDNQLGTYVSWLAGNPLGIPMVVGAKKGYPNFNEFTMNQYVHVVRKLQVTRPATNAPVNATNQMYLIGISNLFGVENWNSYSKAYPYNLNLAIGNLATITLTNQFGLKLTSSVTNGINTNLPANSWAGGQFRLPVMEQRVLLPNSAYRFATTSFDPIGTNVFEKNVGFPLPDWVLSVSNRLVYVLSDGGNIVDFVLLNNITTSTDINAELLSNNAYQGTPGVSATINGVWKTNRVGGTSVFFPTEGIKNQMAISLGSQNTTLAEWNSFSMQNASGQDKDKAIDNLRRFVGLTPFRYPTTALDSDAQLEVQAGFTPAAKMVKTTTWQANDPLVHYQLSDLTLYPTNSLTQRIVPPSRPVPVNTALSTLGRLNHRYAPWGGNPQLNDPFSPTDPTAYEPTVKDPGLRRSDDWDFPAGKFASVGELGRVHRGTPWQTIYLKPNVASSGSWLIQGLDNRVHPTNDWRIVDLFTTAVSDQATRGLLSINQTNFAAWSALFSGVSVWTNAVPDAQLGISNGPITLNPMFMEPAGNYSPADPPALARIVEAINRERDKRPTKTFTNLSELLQIPELTTASPYLNVNSGRQLLFGLNDAAYERIPQQIFSLLKVGSARFVIYSYGQALKPKVIDPGSHLATDYQITAEVATRTVVRLEGPPSRPRAVIESFNILPPE